MNTVPIGERPVTVCKKDENDDLERSSLMAAIGDIVRLSKKITGDSSWYETHRVPIAFRKCHPMILARAAIECGNDWYRCVVDADGSVTVYNYQVWTP